MRKVPEIVLAFVFIGTLSVQSAAQSAVGSWSGKVEVQLSAADRSGIRKNSRTAQVMADVGSLTFSLRLKSDKTYDLHIKGFTREMGAEAPGRHDRGSWVQNGSRIILMSAIGDHPSMSFKMAANERAMAMTMPGAPAGSSAQLTLKR